MDRPLNPKKECDVSHLFTDLTAPFSPDRSAFLSPNDSQVVIAREVARGLELRNMTPYTLFEISGIPIDTIREILEGTHDLSDSGAITAIESVLRIPLRHL